LAGLLLAPLLLAAALWAFQAPLTRLLIDRAVVASEGRLELIDAVVDWRGRVQAKRITWRSTVPPLGAQVAVQPEAQVAAQAAAREVTLAWRWRSLWSGRLELAQLQAQSLVITTPPGDAATAWPELPYPGLDWVIDELRIGELTLQRGQSFWVVHDLRLALSGDAKGLGVQARSGRLQGVVLQAAALQAQLVAPHAFALSAQLQVDMAPWLQGTVVQAGEKPLDVLLELHGDARSAALEASARWHDALLRLKTQLAPEQAALTGPAELQLRELDVRRWVAQAPATSLSGVVLIDTAGQSAQLDLSNALPGVVEQSLLPVRDLKASLSWTDEARLTVSQARLEDSAGGVLQVQGSVEGLTRPPEILDEWLTRLSGAVRFEALDLSRWTQQGVPTQLHGELRWDRGRGALQMRARLNDQAERQSDQSMRQSDQVQLLRDSEIRLQTGIELSTKTLRLSRLQAQVAGVQVSGDAELALAQPHAFSWTGELWGDLAAIAGLKGSARAQGSVRGQLGEQPELSVDLRVREGRLGTRAFTGSVRGTAELKQRHLRDVAVSIEHGRNRLSAQGSLGGEGDSLSLLVQADDLGAIDVRASGRVRIDARFEALPPVAQASTPQRAASWALQNTRLVLQARGDQLRWNRLRLDSLRLGVEGAAQAHQVDVQLSIPGQTLSARGMGQLDRAQDAWPDWQVVLETVVADGVVRANLAQPAQLSLSARAQVLSELNLALVGGGTIRLARLAVEEGVLDARGDIAELPLARLIAWAEQGARPTALPAAVEATIGQLRLQAGWSVQGALPDALTGSIDASVIDTASVGSAHALGLDRNRVALRIEQGRLSGPVELSLSSLALARRYTGPDWQVAGRLGFVGQVGGTLQAPELTGTLRGEALGLFNRALGWRLRDGQLLAQLAPGELRLDKLRFASGVDGELALSGQLSHPPGSLEAASLRGQLDVRAQRLAVPLGPGQRLRVSGDTTLSVSGPLMRWRGALRADDGVIELRSAGVPELPADVRVLGEAPDPGSAPDTAAPASATAAPLLQIETDLRIDLGQAFKVHGGGVDARLEGAVSLSGRLPQQLRANGVLRVREGGYTAWGRRLDIDRGEIRFSGAPDNPALDIVASRTGETLSGQTIKAGVSVTGTALAPRVRLVSEPELPDAQKLSWLVLGTALEDAAGAAQAFALREAAMAILGSDDGGLAGSLNQAFGLEFMGVGPAREGMRDALGSQRLGLPPLRGGAREATAGAAGQQVVTIGRRLSSRLMLSYEQGLNGLANLVRLQYDISRRLSLRAQGGRENAVDLLAWWWFD
jgi:translocation and assembly module TamB